MATGYEQDIQHAVWEILKLKHESPKAARFDNAASEWGRLDIIECLDEALKTRVAR